MRRTLPLLTVALSVTLLPAAPVSADPPGLKTLPIGADAPDKKDAALKVLREQKVAATNHVVRTPDRDRFADLLDKAWAGPLPHTLVIAPGGKVLYRKTGGIDPLEVRRAIVDQLGRTY